MMEFILWVIFTNKVSQVVKRLKNCNNWEIVIIEKNYYNWKKIVIIEKNHNNWKKFVIIEKDYNDWKSSW